MRKATFALLLGAAALAVPVAFSQAPGPGPASPPAASPSGHSGAPSVPGPAVIHPDETHLRNLRQLTFGGQNAEGYWSADGKTIV